MRLKQKIKAREQILGTFIKTPHHHIVEVLSHSLLDVLCLDAEHAPFTRAALDTCVLAANAHNKPVLIRVPSDSPDILLNALDLGATGVVVPHVKCAEQLSSIVRHCYFGPAGRGYAGSTRAARYTLNAMSENIAANRSETVVIAQIEDAEALDCIDDICAVEGCDVVFIGRVDLTLSLGETNTSSDVVVSAVKRIVSVARQHDRNVGMFVSDLSEIPMWQELGVSVFLLSSDHTFLLQGAQRLHEQFVQASQR